MDEFKSGLAGFVSWLIVLGLLCSPWLAMIASILTTIKWYTMYNSVVYGMLGFIVGGTATVVGLVVVFGIMVGVVYLCAPMVVKQDLKVKLEESKGES